MGEGLKKLGLAQPQHRSVARKKEREVVLRLLRGESVFVG